MIIFVLTFLTNYIPQIDMKSEKCDTYFEKTICKQCDSFSWTKNEIDLYTVVQLLCAFAGHSQLNDSLKYMLYIFTSTTLFASSFFSLFAFLLGEKCDECHEQKSICKIQYEIEIKAAISFETTAPNEMFFLFHLTKRNLIALFILFECKNYSLIFYLKKKRRRHNPFKY